MSEDVRDAAGPASPSVEPTPRTAPLEPAPQTAHSAGALPATAPAAETPAPVDDSPIGDRPDDPTTAQLRREVFRLALPVIGEQLLYMMVNVVDTAIAGRVGTEVLAGLGMAAFLSWIMSVILGAVGVGATALVARSVGAADLPTANAATRQSLLLAGIAGAILSAVNVLFPEQLLAAMGLEGAAAEFGAQWMRITGWAWVPTSINLIGAACLRGAGDTHTPMFLMAGVNVINLLLVLALTFGFGPIPAYGAIGIAIGTAVARTIGGVALGAMLLLGWTKLHVSLWPQPAERGLLRRIVRVATPAAVEYLLGAAAMVGYYRIVSELGSAALAAHSVAVRTEGLSYLPGWGFAVAAATLVGQNLGAKRPGAAQRAAGQAFLFGGGVMCAMGLLFAVAGEQLVEIFAPGQPEVIAQGGAALRLVSLGQLGQAATFILCGALRGAGDTRYPLAVTLIGLLVVRLPCAWLFAITLGMGLWGAWLAMVLDLTLRGVLATVRFLRGKWKSVKV